MKGNQRVDRDHQRLGWTSVGASRDFIRSAGSALSKSPAVAQQQEIKGGV